jgi:hypothetical protein
VVNDQIVIPYLDPHDREHFGQDRKYDEPKDDSVWKIQPTISDNPSDKSEGKDYIKNDKTQGHQHITLLYQTVGI